MNYFEQSDKITEGLRKSFHSADAKMANRVCYGYITLPNGELTIHLNMWMSSLHPDVLVWLLIEKLGAIYLKHSIHTASLKLTKLRILTGGT